MIAENFKWLSGTELETSGQTLDLHNDYNFQTVEHNVVDKTVRLNWRRGTEKWVKEDLPNSLCLVFFEVHHFSVVERDPEIPFTEDDCLSRFGYRDDETPPEWQIQWKQETIEIDPAWRWSFQFHSHSEICIGGARATAQTEPIAKA